MLKLYICLFQKIEIIFSRAGEPEPGVFGSLEPELEPEPLEKKTRSRSRLEKSQEKSGAGAGEN